MLKIIVVAVLLLIAAAAFIMWLRKKPSKTDTKTFESGESDYSRDFDPPMPRYVLAIISGAALLAALCFAGFTSFYTQDPGEAIVTKSFTGQVTGHTEKAGMHYKPFWDSTENFNVRNQRIEMFSNPGGQGADGAALSVPVKGGANADVSITVIYSIKPSAVEAIYNDFQTQEGLRENAMKSKLRDVVRNASANYTPLQIKEQRAKLGNQISEEIAKQWDRYGISIEQVNLGDIRLDPDTEQAISNVNTEQQGVEQARAALQKSQIQAETTKTEAQAQADADQIIRCGATTVKTQRMIDGKETEVTVVTPKSNKECENRLNEQVLTTKWYEALKEAGAKGNTIIVAPADGAAPIISLPGGKTDAK